MQDKTYPEVSRTTQEQTIKKLFYSLQNAFAAAFLTNDVLTAPKRTQGKKQYL